TIPKIQISTWRLLLAVDCKVLQTNRSKQPQMLGSDRQQEKVWHLNFEPGPRDFLSGAIIDTESGVVFLSQRRREDIKALAAHFFLTRMASLAQMSKLVGKMIPCLDIRTLKDTSPIRVRLPTKVLTSLLWWTSSALDKGCSFKDRDFTTITTDASLSGWGAHCQDKVAQGIWNDTDLKHNINWI
ncbi:putative Reverse transcriptase-ribonuclease H-putative methyltransferase-like protein, partial [Naja naja]